MSDFIVGITGGIGSGKTAVSDRFAKLGIDIVDADIVAREVVAPDSQAVAEIAAHFGPNALLSDGNLDRMYLRQAVFSSPSDKTWLDNLLHPLIRQQMLTQVKQATSAYCILSVPLLIENQLTSMVDRTLVVDVDEATQLARASSRDLQTETQIKNIMAHQASRAERLSHADDVIDNSGPEDQLDPQVQKLHQLYLKLSQVQH
ncbi:dephospho-CoA kinase [Aliiglaciecola litoralis]|uniref:Dephospho-CoA kinase n=1 Tax=Aliiglaciecola litoralis TaxID=582857 RepID=A0ABN1LQR9_9ALTE